MGDIIAWKAAEEVIKLIAAENAMVAGMSIEEAAAALGYTLTKSGMYVKTVTDVASVAGAGATAGEAIAGTVATGGATATTANLTLYTTASGTTAVGGLGSIALPVAACCLAGAGGYMIGNVAGDYIDKKFPDFFDGLFSSVSKFLTGDEHSLAFIFNEKGEAFMPEASQQAIDAYIQQQLANKTLDSVIVNSSPVYFRQLGLNDTIFAVLSSNYYNYWKVNSIISTSPIYQFSLYYEGKQGVSVGLVSKEPFEISYYNYNSKDDNVVGPRTIKCNINSSGYAGHLNSGPLTLDGLIKFPTIDIPTPSLCDSTTTLNDVMLGILNGEVQSDSTIPKIDKFEIPDRPKIEVPSKYPSWVPVPMPATKPNQLPNETPDPNEEPDPSKVSPYLPQPQPYPEGVPKPTPIPDPEFPPMTIPVPQPEPAPQPTPSPEEDPSKEPAPVPQPEPSPVPPPPTPQPTPVPPLPVPPPISSEATGLLHVYNPTNSEINEFGAWLWTTFSGDLIDTLGKLFNNPMEAVIGLHELYCTPITGEPVTIKAGFLESNTTSRLVTKRYTEINCGAITVPEYWGNYLDYEPYTKVSCYLPFIGIVELNTDDIIGHGVQIVYKIDSYNGSCIAMINTAKDAKSEATVYQFSGNCAVEVPITSGMKSAIQSALIGAGTCAIGAAIGGAAVPVIAGMAVNNSVKMASNNKNQVSHSGSFGSSYGAMGIKTPYIIVKRPVQKVVNGYNKKYGYPAHKMVTIGSCSGYLRCRDFDVQSSTATEDEKKLIETLLKQGVYV